MFMRAAHPGEILKDELDELGMTPTEFARQIAVPANRISQIIAGKRRRHRRHRASLWTLVRHRAAVLAQSARRL